MTTIAQNALTILRIMNDLGVILERSKPPMEIALLAHLDGLTFSQADRFLLDAGYVDGTVGSRWLTAAGIKYLEAEMAERLPLSLEAEIILRYVIESAPIPEHLVSRKKIIQSLDLDPVKYDAACQQLADWNLITEEEGSGVRLVSARPFDGITSTKEGRRVYYDNFRRPQGAQWRTNMTIFNQRGQKVTYQYNAAGNINFDSVQNKVDVVAELEKIQAEVAKAIEAGVFDEDTAADVEYKVKKAVQQAKKPDPNKKSILDHLAEAKALIEGVAAAAGLVQGLAQAAQVVQQLFQ